MNDHDLHSLFARERQLDRNRTPVFQHMLTRARHQSPVATRHGLRWAAAGAALGAVLVAGFVANQAGDEAPSFTKSLPVLLEASAEPEPLFPSLASSPDSPSDFLMPQHATFKVL